jgi:uncharacterized protein with PQ loop repeat
MENEKPISEKDSLRIITAMIAEAKGGYFHDSGIGAILWGTVVGIAGFMTFFSLHYDWKLEFDWWILTLVALLPQAFISYRERKTKVVKTQVGIALDTIWVVYGISIFAIITYSNISPVMAEKFLAEEGYVLMKKNLETGELTKYPLLWAFSPGSLLLLIFALPTMVTGVVKKFWPMIIGAVFTYMFFIISLYTRNPIDQLLMGLAGVINWLIPGFIMRAKYLQSGKSGNV